MQSTDFVVARNDFKQCKLIETHLPDPDALPDDTLLVIDRFAFTANNITYAILGERLSYWRLFPAPADFGNIPVWGFGDVIASKNPAVPEGERLFGYFPMATHLVIEAGNVSKRGLRDTAAHRQAVAPVYNAYARVANDPAYAGRQGDYQALVRPLFMLSFLVDDYLAENEFFGARSVMLSSASSKTASGLAHLLHGRKKIRLIGLTSAGNADFVRSLGCYDEVIAYDRVSTLPADTPTAFVDMAGNADLRAAAPTFRRRAQIFGPGRADASELRSRRGGTAGRQTSMVLRTRPYPQAHEGMGTGRHRCTIVRGVGGFRAYARPVAQGDRKPRPHRGQADLSRYPRRTYSAGSGEYSQTIGNSDRSGDAATPPPSEVN